MIKEMAEYLSMHVLHVCTIVVWLQVSSFFRDQSDFGIMQDLAVVPLHYSSSDSSDENESDDSGSQSDDERVMDRDEFIAHFPLSLNKPHQRRGVGHSMNKQQKHTLIEELGDRN